ncbi:MAG: hypothetical protein ACXVB0_17095 [Mucilaginibacter sp.]
MIGKEDLIMGKPNRHYKFINSKTGYVIYYHSINDNLKEEKIKEELDKIKVHVAIQNGIYVDTVYWEEIKDES